ncbi:MAG: hypothetical protein PHS44_06310 [Candidatus Dojkabacteria bacterium]|nr:hypothetical protein [Candidatus Dojkabacteria bacterium]
MEQTQLIFIQGDYNGPTETYSGAANVTRFGRELVGAGDLELLRQQAGFVIFDKVEVGFAAGAREGSVKFPDMYIRLTGMRGGDEIFLNNLGDQVVLLAAQEGKVFVTDEAGNPISAVDSLLARRILENTVEKFRKIDQHRAATHKADSFLYPRLS